MYPSNQSNQRFTVADSDQLLSGAQRLLERLERRPQASPLAPFIADAKRGQRAGAEKGLRVKPPETSQPPVS